MGAAPQAAGETSPTGKANREDDCQRGLGLHRRPHRQSLVDNPKPVFTAVTASPLADSTVPVLGTDGRYHVVYELLLRGRLLAQRRLLDTPIRRRGGPDGVPKVPPRPSILRERLYCEGR
jgi:hypothetical protein